eukprot:7304047-Pyramimonas_sp.AAC.1
MLGTWRVAPLSVAKMQLFTPTLPNSVVPALGIVTLDADLLDNVTWRNPAVDTRGRNGVAGRPPDQEVVAN